MLLNTFVAHHVMCEHWLIWYFCLVRDGAVLLNFYYICQLLYIILLNQTHYIVKCKNLIYWRKLSTLFYLSSVILWTSVMNFCVLYYLHLVLKLKESGVLLFSMLKSAGIHRTSSLFCLLFIRATVITVYPWHVVVWTLKRVSLHTLL